MTAEEVTPGSLLELARTRKRLRGGLCTLRKLIVSKPELGADIQELLDNTGDRGDRIPYATAAEVIGETFQTKLEGATVSRHVNGRCACS